MARNNITEYASDASQNRDIQDINIAENCPVRNINNAIRTLMAHLKEFDQGNTILTSPSATSITVTDLNIGHGWVIKTDADGILFNLNGVTQAKLLNDGEFRAGDITGSVTFD